MSQNENTITVLSVGGSIVAPDKVDIPFVQRFREMLIAYLDEDSSRKVILIIGGGGLARHYQEAYRELSSENNHEAQDWLGIMATRVNAQLIKAVFGDDCREEVVTDPTTVSSFSGRVLVAAGWKPGFSTDADAVYLAEKFNADTVINLSNIAKVYSDDPKLNPDAVPLDTITWEEFLKMTDGEWVPGKNCPLDPVASKKAAELKLKIITAAGTNIENTRKILEGAEFEGTVIG